MPFNSYLFLFAFLPITLLGYYLTANRGHSRIAIVWLVAASLVFYGWFNPIYVALISISVLINYLFGLILTRYRKNNQRLVIILCITFNILLLGYFKYTNFFVGAINTLFHSDFPLDTIILPLAISFFTLQQITYLVDIYRDKISQHSFLDYCLFITFFPKLISGPIVRFSEMMPQVIKDHMPHVTKENVAIGLTVLCLGLFKKLILADSIGAYANPVFDAAANGTAISFFNGWIGALSYTFQLYFDFSGYCDMAIGAALMFGIRLPLNFYSPYKATSIIDFWRRWHMTLSRFLRDYLYIPLGGNRKGLPRQMMNLLVVMAIAGLWHGAGLTFIIWGALHGLYLAVNHGWRRLRQKFGKTPEKTSRLGMMVSILFTFIMVTLAWVFFRATSVGAATGILKGMAGLNGFLLPTAYQPKFGEFLGHFGINFGAVPGFSDIAVIWILALLIICWFLPNAQEYMANYKPALDSFPGEVIKPRTWLRWSPSLWKVVVIAIIAVLAILGLSHTEKFIYFQF